MTVNIQTGPATAGPTAAEERLATPTLLNANRVSRHEIPAFALNDRPASNESWTSDHYPKRRIGPVTFDATNLPGAISRILMAVQARSCDVFAFCNMHTFNLARCVPTFAAALDKAIVFNDGLGIDLASLILFGKAFPHNLNGTDLTPALLMSLGRPISLFVLGSPPGVAEQAATALQNRFPNVSITGWHHGYFSSSESGQIADRIRDAQTDLVLVGMGNPRQELWAVEMAARTGAVMVCVGAFLDFASGRVPRAPRFVRAIRCEWIYRLAREPARLARRYIGGAAPFIWAILTERISLHDSGTGFLGVPIAGRQESEGHLAERINL